MKQARIFSLSKLVALCIAALAVIIAALLAASSASAFETQLASRSWTGNGSRSPLLDFPLRVQTFRAITGTMMAFYAPSTEPVARFERISTLEGPRILGVLDIL